MPLTHTSVIVADHWHNLGVLHLRFDPVVLPEDASRHEGAGDTQHHGEHVPQHGRLDAGQDADQRSSRFLLHRVRVQRVVHFRDTR